MIPTHFGRLYGPRSSVATFRFAPLGTNNDVFKLDLSNPCAMKQYCREDWWHAPVGEAYFAICDTAGTSPQVRWISFGLLRYFLASETSILVAIRFAPSSR